MCSNCKAQVDHGVAALEALANGEAIPETENAALPDGAQPIPMVVADFGDKVGIVTSKEGWIALKVLMSMIGGIIPLDGD
ncbi:hypothetical protein QF034_007258 [Streptomyces africanus]|uniref:Uncharacterized protein n=1 Tax=Streptomyces africanus TaxID=231024 RepID=A0ABU0R352_9ACTN|nr:hypothetical protein [Streptomyces africanus]MDQ0753027.1 hypothetical protein [Streptomyces africanus]